ncbi:MAG TPA: hypothetical protein VN739_02665 [Nitrososphaerales archaeon]|nr:hypothetical protein [Nitrososphaerales archaeon]
MIPRGVSIRFSRRRHFPFIAIHESEFWPHEFVRLLWISRTWKLLEDSDELSVLRIDGSTIKLLSGYRQMFFSEFGKWKKWYLPSDDGKSIKGQIVLDVGAGCGESAYFFLKNGASKVICIEPDKKAFEVLRENSKVNGWNVELLNEYFSLAMISYSYDFLKMDCEGCEDQLLNLTIIEKPSVIEVHNKKLSEELRKKFQLKSIYEKGEISIIRNF